MIQTYVDIAVLDTDNSVVENGTHGTEYYNQSNTNLIDDNNKHENNNIDNDNGDDMIPPDDDPVMK